jgi:hypothetical protein
MEQEERGGEPAQATRRDTGPFQEAAHDQKNQR